MNLVKLKHIEFNNDLFIILDMMCSNASTPQIMVFRPTWSEFQNFSSYIELMESQGAHQAGVAKVCYNKNVVFLIYFSDFIVAIQPFFCSKYVILIL